MFFPVDHSSKSRSCVQRFDSFKANEVEPNVANSGLARLCGSFTKEKIFLQRTLTKSVEKIKVTKLKYFIIAWLHLNNPLKRKDVR